MALTRAQVTLGILAGGQATRLGGVDKALARQRGQTLVQRTVDALGEGFAQALVSYNGVAAAQLPGSLRVVGDLRPGHPGPLAGIEALLVAAERDWLLTVPVDLGEIPASLVSRLLESVRADAGVVARDADGLQPLVALWPVSRARVVVGAAFDAGEGAVHRVQQQLGFGVCELGSLLRLGNLNAPADFDAAG